MAEPAGEHGPDEEAEPAPEPAETQPDQEQPLTDEQILQQLRDTASIGDEARERREQGLTFTELGADREAFFAREREEALHFLVHPNSCPLAIARTPAWRASGCPQAES